jgi:hypothetical protein
MRYGMDSAWERPHDKGGITRSGNAIGLAK